MSLLNVHTFQLVKPGPIEAWPPYATVSHCRECQDVTIDDRHDVDTQDLNFDSQTAVPPWIIRACIEVRAFGVDLLWVATHCMGRSSRTEHSAAINSLFQIFQGAQICLVHLEDIEAPKNSLEHLGQQIQQSRWAKRVWMLQELIASEDLQFYDAHWNPVGTKRSLLPILSRQLGIDAAVLEDSKCLLDFPVARRMSWASRLSTIRPEDFAYSLLGIFGVHLTIMYGEGGIAAFIRLQEEILKGTDDVTLFAWKSADDQKYRGAFAHSPSEFEHFGVQSRRIPLKMRGKIQKSPTGILICDSFILRSARSEIALCVLGENDLKNDRLIFGIPLLKWNNQYVRASPSLLLNLDKLPKGRPGRICITRDVSPTTSSTIAMQIACQSKLLNNAIEIKTNTSGKKRHAVNNTFCFEQRSPIHKSTRNRNSQTTSDLATCVFKTEDKSGRIAVSAVGSTSTLFLGSLVPSNETRNHQVGNEPPRIVTAAEPSPQRWQQVLERRPRKRTRDMSYSSDSEDTDSWNDQIPVLDDDDPLMGFVEELTESCLALFSQSIGCRSREQVFQGPSAANKRQKLSGDFESTHTQCNARSVGTASTITTGPRVRNLPFTCLFYIRAPNRYQSCVKHGGFSTFRDLCRHLSSSHRLPHFCPACGEIFPRASICDDHIRTMSCDVGPEPNFEGVSENQIVQLFDRSKLLQSREAQWIETWQNIFIGREQPPVLYFASNIELYIHSLREYWAQNGQDVISSVLKSKETQGNKIHANEQEKMALNQTVLDRMVDELVKLLMPTEGGLQNGKSFQQPMEEVRGV